MSKKAKRVTGGRKPPLPLDIWDQVIKEMEAEAAKTPKPDPFSKSLIETMKKLAAMPPTAPPAPLTIGISPTGGKPVSIAKTGRAFSSTVDERLMKTLEDARAVRTGMPVVDEEAVAKIEAEIVYGEGEVALSELVTFSDGSTSKMPIRRFPEDFFPPEVRQFIPCIDEGYMFDREATEAVVMSIMQGDTLLLHGPKGSGKTTLPQQICARIGMPYTRVNCRMDMESGNLFGANSVRGGELLWHDGPLVELAKYGGLICIDEISRTPPGINASLMAVLERGGVIFLGDKAGTIEEKTVQPNPWFRIVATDNTELQGDTTGKYVGTNVQDEAMIDRFATTIKLGYLHPKHEEAIIAKKFPETTAVQRKRMVQMANMIREAYDTGNLGFTMSPRGLLEWSRKLTQWRGNNEKAFKLSFYNKLIPADKKVVGEFYHSVFATNLTD